LTYPLGQKSVRTFPFIEFSSCRDEATLGKQQIPLVFLVFMGRKTFTQVGEGRQLGLDAPQAPIVTSF